ncbi:MAG: metallophosphoesterase [Planctomycetota bacterium]|nr:metallophosphoesterase [Planctomycetota bacterium]MDA1249515.1 metallophosphoesterase [Planctomycetota bacterium]
MPILVEKLFEGPVDVVGDIHGEIDALLTLMGHLGYDEAGHNPSGRRLVFVGDLTDRGPDSPAVVDLVTELLACERAQCVLGNHDLNILLGTTKHDNGWYFGHEFSSEGELVPQKLADDGIRARVQSLFASLPLALERPDLRVVHAAWNANAIESLPPEASVAELFKEHRARIDVELMARDADELERGLCHQIDNPVKMITSGPEERIETPFESSGKVRFQRRVEWWPDYRGPLCVFGHYSLPPERPRDNPLAFCVDFNVGKRWRERRETSATGPFRRTRLAAFRFPERVVMFDDGNSQLWSVH